MTAWLLAAALAAGGDRDQDFRQALELVYSGFTETAIQKLGSLAAASPDDPTGWYLEALALCWKIEEQPSSTALDPLLHAKLDHAISVAEARLRADPRDLRALLARAGAHGVRCRLHLFRWERWAAARAAARMRSELLEVRELDPASKDVVFGLGLYEYFAGALPGAVKLLRFLTGLPGGDRERGLRLIEGAGQGTLFHSTEVQVQLFEIYADFEGDPDRALVELRDLRSRYPDAPLWGLKLTELLCRMGLYGESAAVAREVLDESWRGHSNYTAVVAAMARVSLGEALLLDLSLDAAREALLAARDGFPGQPRLATAAEWLLGRCLELSGDRESSLVHYRKAALGADPEVRRQAREALSSPIPAEQVRAAGELSAGRRLREAGRWGEAALAYRRALEAWPHSQEAALGVAEELIREGQTDWAREVARRAATAPAQASPPWVTPWSHLLLGRICDLAGMRDEARREYRRVLAAASGRVDFKRAAEQGLETPYSGGAPREGRPGSSHYRN